MMENARSAIILISS